MSVNRGTYSFWPASAPNQYHEMDPARSRPMSSPRCAAPAAWAWTRRSSGASPCPRMRRQLDDYLTEVPGGSLVIEGDGNLRLEP